MVKTLKIVRVKRKFPRTELPKRRFEGRLFPIMGVRPYEQRLNVLVKNHLDKIHEMQKLVKENVAQIQFMQVETDGAKFEHLFDTGQGSAETAWKGWGFNQFSYGESDGIRNNFGSNLSTGHLWVTARSALFKEGIDKARVLERMKKLNEEIKVRHGALMKNVQYLDEDYSVSGKKGSLAMFGKEASRQYRELRNAGGGGIL